MTKIGYARNSFTEQNLARQLEQLNNVDKTFQKSISRASREHP